MIDAGKLNYHLIVLDETGARHDLKDCATKIGWEENEKELSTRLTFRCQNKIPSGYASDVIKIGCLAVVFASSGGAEEEVVRGYIKEWEPSVSASENSFTATCYDELFSLEKSQDSFYIQSGQTTQAVINQILSAWGVTAVFQGSNVTHGKLKFQSKALADCLMEILEDAVEKGGKECIIRAEKGVIQIIPKGSNQNVYVFGADNGIKLSHKRSISNMVTRVKVIGRETKDGRYPVEAVVDGKTEFGVLQKVMTRETSQSIAEAKSAAQKILDEDGQVEEKISLSLPDVPYVRKGDYIYINNVLGSVGYMEVLSIQHDADTASMTVTVKPVKEAA